MASVSKAEIESDDCSVMVRLTLSGKRMTIGPKMEMQEDLDGLAKGAVLVNNERRLVVKVVLKGERPLV